MGLTARFGLALALTCLLLPNGNAQERADHENLEELATQEHASFEALDAFVGRHLDGWLLGSSVSDEDVELLLALYDDVTTRLPELQPKRRWLASWSHGKRLLARGDGVAAVGHLEHALERALTLTASDPTYGVYLWRVFEDLAPLAMAGLGASSFDQLAGTCFEALPNSSPEHPWLLQIVVDGRVRAADFAAAHGLLDASHDDYASTGSHPLQIVDYLRAYAHLAEGRPVLAQPLARDAFDFFWGASSEEPTAFVLPSLEVLVDVWSSLGAHAVVVDKLPRYLEDEGRRLEGLDTSRLRLALAMSLIEVSELQAAEETLEALCQRAGLPAALQVQARARLADLALRAGDPERALRQVEVSLARREEGGLTAEELALPLALGLRATRRAGRASAGLDRFLPELERRVEEILLLWSEQPLVEGGLGLLRHTSERTVISELLTGLSETRGPAAAFEALVEVEATSSWARHLGGTAARVNEVRQSLVPKGGGLIDFFYDEDVLHVFAIDHEHVVHETVEKVAGLSERIARYQAFLLRAPTPTERAARLELWRALSVPLAKQIFPPRVRTALAAWPEMRFASTEILGGQLSLDSLPVVSDAPLGLERAVSNLPSVPVGMSVVGPLPSPYSLDLVLLTNAAGNPQDGQAPLEMSDAEVQALIGPFSPERVHVLTGKKADLPNLAAAVADARMLHLFEHGATLDDAAIATAARIAPSSAHDGVLKARDLVELAPLPPVVLLSVCGAARGLPRVGDPGASDLRGACLRAGARTLFAAAGDVNQLATQRLMVHVHRALASGTSPARALQEARAALYSEEGDRFQDPYYYSLIQVLGRAHASCFERARPKSPARAADRSQRR